METEITARPNSGPGAAYIHVPFCIHRCGYCDFTVVADRDDLITSYLDCLERELEIVLHNQQRPHTETLFIGGGTPSYLPVPDLKRLFAMLSDSLSLVQGGEFSMECNPENFTVEQMDVIAEAGVNRISLGVQSFDQTHLTTLERRHSPAVVARVMEQLRKRGINNISIDLIFAIPGQTLADWERTLQQAIDLEPTHISTYGLTFEKGTSFWTRRNKRLLQPADDELERAMYDLAMTLLPKHRYEQYELSNFAAPGFRCRHNQVYWNANEYYGFGPGAARYMNGVRACNHRSVSTWINRLRAGQSPLAEQETLSDELRSREAVMLGLRQIRGISQEFFSERYGHCMRSLNPVAYDQFLDQKLIEVTNGHVRLTFEGRFIADTIMAEFL